jgi:hypothetical protein
MKKKEIRTKKLFELNPNFEKKFNLTALEFH